MDNRTKLYCVGHKPPDFTPPIDYAMLCPKSLGISNEIVISDDRFGINVDGASLAEYSQLFGLAELIKSGDIAATHLYLFQYRKFISPILGGYESIAPWVKVLSPNMSPHIFPSPEHLYNITNNLIVGDVFNFGESIAQSYSKTHVLEDLTAFTAACAGCDKISPDLIKSLINMNGIIPSPTLCAISVDLFLSLMEVLKEVSEIFMDNYYVRRIGYQSRSTGYLLERLHSQLILQLITKDSLSDVLTWQRYVVNTEISEN
jgi:hypothetical protein